MSLVLGEAAAITLEILCKLINCYQHHSSHTHRAAPTPPALGFFNCVLRTTNEEFEYLLLCKRQGEGCMSHSEQKALMFETAMSSWVNLGLASTAALPHACVNTTPLSPTALQYLESTAVEVQLLDLWEEEGPSDTLEIRSESLVWFGAPWRSCWRGIFPCAEATIAEKMYYNPQLNLQHNTYSTTRDL